MTRTFAFSLSGAQVAAMDMRSVLRRWTLRAGDLMARARDRVRTNRSAADWLPHEHQHQLRMAALKRRDAAWACKSTA